MKKLLYMNFLLVFYASFYAQGVSYDKVKQEYISFEYEKVIQLSNELLSTTTLSNVQLIDVYLMRAVSYYTLGNERSAQNDFREILRVNKNYSPDPSQISPKLISLFSDIKAAYLKSLEPTITETDSTQEYQATTLDYSLLKGSIIRNIVLPGWGQLHSQALTKGVILSAASAVNLISMVYFIINTSKKENEYLLETNKNLIQLKYENYNRSYKIRNTLITTLVAMWLYSQVDLLFFSNKNNIQMEESNINSAMIYDSTTRDFQLHFRLSF